MKPHPATFLVGWVAFAMMLQWVVWQTLLVMAVVIFPATFVLAGRRGWQLLKRARWLLLSIALLFSTMTDGAALPGPLRGLGVTEDGCQLAILHVLRLTLLLSGLALLLEHLSILQLIEGLYWLLAPLGDRFGRSRIALRLLLVLEYVQQNDKVSRRWQDWLLPQNPITEHPPLELMCAPLTGMDGLIMVLSVVAMMMAWV